MHVRVKLFATLMHYSSGKYSGAPFDLELPAGSTLKDLIRLLNIPEEYAKVAFVNGIIRPMDWVIQAEDEVGIFPPIGGGYYAADDH